MSRIELKMMISWKTVEKAMKGSWVRCFSNTNGPVKMRAECIYPAVNSVMRKY